MKKDIKYGGKLDTKMDLSELDLDALTKLRKRASDMGLLDFIARIDEVRAKLKAGTGQLGDRERLYHSVFGKLPQPSRPAQYRSEYADGRLLLEVPETEIIPGIGEQRTRGVKWVWEKSAAQIQRDRAAARAESLASRMRKLEALDKLRDDLASAAEHGAQVYLVLYRPHRESGKAFRMPPVLGSVEVQKSGAFKVEFYDERLRNPGLHPRPIIQGDAQ